MKKVLIIDESELFRSYLKERLSEYFTVEVSVHGLDGLSKLRTFLPDLVIMDHNLTRKSCKEILEDKSRNPNTAEIPVILTAQKIDRNRLLELVQFRISKILMKPLMIDTLFDALNEIMGMKLRVDETPCIIEAHVNDNIIFIEVARGINREKADLLHFKVAELIDLYQISNPRILMMLSDIDLSFVDGSNLEVLLRVLLAHTKGKSKHIKILTISSFMREFISGRQEFREIEVVSNLQNAMDGLLVDYDPEGEHNERAEMISERILAKQGTSSGAESFEMRFQTESQQPVVVDTAMKDSGAALSIAVVDDDFIIQELVKTTFTTIEAEVSAFSDGREFLANARAKNWDLVFLDLLMPGIGGFDVLKRLRAEEIDIPVIILSAVTQREAVVKAVEAGVKSYLIKPLKPDQILKKTLEILKANF
ncbi:MAG: response regulator [Spirochaetota bacterium]